MSAAVVELEDGRTGVWLVDDGHRVFHPIDMPVVRPLETTHFCQACGCWLLDELEPCPACATFDVVERREAAAAATEALTNIHRAEYEQLLAGEYQKRGIA